MTKDVITALVDGWLVVAHPRASPADGQRCRSPVGRTAVPSAAALPVAG
eukprot:COSAG06_NODE_1946_length_8005_cov_5.434986_5_plen_49_part_00